MTASDLSATIRNQYNAIKCNLGNPTKIYMSRKHFCELDRAYADQIRYSSTNTAVVLTFMGLKIKIHDDFPEPEVL
jgi:hypothetical protein